VLRNEGEYLEGKEFLNQRLKNFFYSVISCSCLVAMCAAAGSVKALFHHVHYADQVRFIGGIELNGFDNSYSIMWDSIDLSALDDYKS